MMFAPSRLPCVVLWWGCVVAAPALAESLATSASSAGSSASSAGSASSGSLSDSINNSSKSSTGTTATADGDYRVIEVAELADRPGMLQLTLHASAPDGEREFTLRLPARALAPHGIAAGDVVQVRNRDYGLEFARAAGAGARDILPRVARSLASRVAGEPGRAVRSPIDRARRALAGCGVARRRRSRGASGVDVGALL
jgi:hypothetical protein